MNRSWVEVDLTRFDRNVAAIRDAAGSETEPILVVKANAYGHGLSRIAARAAQCGIRWFAVAYLDEAIETREAAPDAGILVLGAMGRDDVPAILEHRLTPVIISEEQADALAAEAGKRGVMIPVHLKVDTGMGRFGVPWEDAVSIYERLAGNEGLAIEGVCTHFASVELGRPSLGPMQMERFVTLTDEMIRKSDRPLFRHASSSRAFLYHRAWDLDGIRPGIMLYGYGSGLQGMRARTEPILQWKTRVMMVKPVPANFPVGYYSSFTTKHPTRIATLAAGYADGYPRLLSNRGIVLIHGKTYPVVGRISMNWITVDVGDDRSVTTGDVVTLLGTEGEHSFWANDMAKQARTIPYEILTGIDPRAERFYTD